MPHPCRGRKEYAMSPDFHHLRYSFIIGFRHNLLFLIIFLEICSIRSTDLYYVHTRLTHTNIIPNTFDIYRFIFFRNLFVY